MKVHYSKISDDSIFNQFFKVKYHLSFMREFEKALQNLFLGQMPNRFSPVEERHSDTTAADVRASHCQRSRSSSLRERASVVPRAAPVFLAPLCDITRPAPLPLLGCARRQ